MPEPSEWMAPSKETVGMAMKVAREAEDDHRKPAWTKRDVEWARWVLDNLGRRPNA